MFLISHTTLIVQAYLGSLSFLWLNGCLLLFVMTRLCLLPFPILGIVTGEVADITSTVEHQEMIYYLIHKVTVVAHDDNTPLEALQILFEHLQGNDVQIVRRLVEHQEVRIAHQHRTEVKPPAFSAAQFIDVTMLSFGSKEEVLQKLRSGKPLAVAQFDDFGNVADYIDHLHLFVKLKSVLRIVTEANCLTNIQCATVWFHQSHQYLDKGRFSGTVVTDNTHLLVTGKDIREIIQYFQITKRLTQVVGLEYLVADVRSLHIEFDVGIVKTLLCHLLQFIESIFAITRLVSACLRHTAHPLQLGTIQVVGTFDFYRLSIDPFLSFLQIVAVVSFVRIDRTVVYFDNLRTYPVEEVTVVSHHQQSQVRTPQILFQPLGHVEVKVVGRLIQNQQIGFGNQGVGQRHTLQLSARKVLYLLVEVAYLQLRKYLFGFLLIIPSFLLIHAKQEFIHTGMTFGCQASFVLLNQIHGAVAMMKAGFEHRQFFGVMRTLLQIAHAKVSTKGYLSLVVTFLTRQDTQ